MPEITKKFTFRTTKDDSGKEIEAAKPLELKLQALDLEGVIALLKLNNPKVIDTIVDSLNSVIFSYVRDLIADKGVEAVRENGIPAEEYSFVTISELPPASKSMFDEDTWNAFKQDYKSVIIAAGGVSEKQAEIGAEILAGRLNRVKGNKTALEQFRVRINTWFTNSGKQEEMAKVFQYLIGRCEGFITANEPETVLASF